MSSLSNCISDLESLREKYGTSIYDSAVKTINRRRLESAHPKRIRVTKIQREHMWFAQKGFCSICGRFMPPDWPMQVDHTNINAEDYNSKRNLKLAHARCNQSKGARTLSEQAKFSRRTVKQQLGGQ